MSNWWEEYAAKYGARIKSNQASYKRVSAMTQLPFHHAKALARFVRRAEVPTLPAPFDSEAHSPATVTPPVEREADGDASASEAGAEFFYKGSYVYDPTARVYVTFVSGLPPIRTSKAEHEQICRGYSNMLSPGATINQLAREMRMPRPWLKGYLRAHGITHDREPFTAEELAEKSDEQLVQDAYQLRRLEFYRSWQVAEQKADKDDADKWRRFEASILGPLVASVANSPVPAVRPLDIKSTPDELRYCGVLSSSDWHWGKGCSLAESGEVYNRAVCRARAFAALDSIAKKAARYGRPEKIYVPIGSDFFHVDTEKATTTSGTPQDMDCTPAEMAVSGCHFMREFILACAQVAPVECVLMSGNHDRLLGVMLMTYLRAAMEGVDRVTVHEDRTPRVYKAFGVNVFGFAHGDGVGKTRDLAGLMAREAPDMRGGYRTIFTGHLHTEAKDEDEYFGVQRIQFPSISGTDRWHAQNGYVGGRKSAAMYMFGYHDGPQGQFYGLAA